MEFRSKLEEIAKDSSDNKTCEAQSRNSDPQLTGYYMQKEFPSAYRTIDDSSTAYIKRVKTARNDFERNIPWKNIILLSVNQMGPWLYGYTQLQADWAVVRDDQGRRTKIHECRHEESEYLTRVKTESMLDEIGLLPYDEQNAARFMYGNRKHLDN